MADDRNVLSKNMADIRADEILMESDGLRGCLAMSVYNTFGWRLDLVGLWEGALPLFPPVNKVRMYHFSQGHYFHTQ